jgi:hypothetical protein
MKVPLGNFLGAGFGSASELARGGLGGAGGDLLQGAQGLVDGGGVGEGVEQVGLDEDEIAALLHSLRIFAPDALAEVEVGTRGEGIELRRLLHTVALYSHNADQLELIQGVYLVGTYFPVTAVPDSEYLLEPEQ